MKKYALITLLLLLLAFPATAVLQEKSLESTLRVLLSELKETVAALQGSDSSLSRMKRQHQMLLDLVERSNELSVVMYSQPPGNTFELTYALNSTTREYENFKKQKLPYDEIINSIRENWSRYSRLSQALAKIPPEISELHLPVITIEDTDGVVIDTLRLTIPSFAVGDSTLTMDPQTTLLRDSCLLFTDQLVNYYYDRVQDITRDNHYYEETDALLKEAYDYALERYRVLQRQVFLEGSRGYPFVLRHFPLFYQMASRDMNTRYGANAEGVQSSWKGPIVWLFAFAMLAILVLAIVLANLLVRLTIRWIPWFKTDFFQSNRGMFITMAGTVLFIIFSFSAFASSEETFFSMAGRIMGEYAILLGAVFLSVFIRLEKEARHSAIYCYLPVFILAFLVFFFRIIFIPDSALLIVFPPLVLLFTIWQVVVNIRRSRPLPTVDKLLLWASAIVMACTTAISWAGLVMMSLLVLIWWLFQLIILQMILALGMLIDKHYKKGLPARQMAYRKKHPYLPLSARDGAFIEVSWAYDLAKTLVLPLLTIWSIPAAVNFACRVFNLNNVAGNFFMRPLINVEEVLNLSLFKVVIIFSLFFLFRFAIYAIKAFYRIWRTRAALDKMNDPSLFKESDINFNLANNVISLAGWGIFVVVAFALLDIPMSALTIITTGLAAGIGFAMKDILNNFFYGVQLMGGRVRVGDTIECDGIRGTVEALSYQSTQVASEDGSIIAFTNSALFNKNFKNLTRNHQYELIKVEVGVKYGTDVQKARQIIKEAVEPLLGKDKYGRDLVDMKRGMNIRLASFGDSSVNISISLFASVEVHYSLPAQIKEAVYNAFNDNGIEIPFPQRDVYIKESSPQKP